MTANDKPTNSGAPFYHQRMLEKNGLDEQPPAERKAGDYLNDLKNRAARHRKPAALRG